MGLFGLFGGFGEFAEWTEPVHRQLLEAGNGDGTVKILPMSLSKDTIAAEDLRLYGSLGIPASVVDVTSRPDAENTQSADALADASLIFLHGGMMDWMCDVLRDTPVWRALLLAVRRGASFAGTSGGVACLGHSVPSFNRETGDATWLPGMNVLSRAVLAAHWDNDKYEVLSRPFRELRQSLVVAIAERTSLVGDGSAWTTYGQGAVHVLNDGHEERHTAGASFDLDLGVRISP